MAHSKEKGIPVFAFYRRNDADLQPGTQRVEVVIGHDLFKELDLLNEFKETRIFTNEERLRPKGI